MGSKRFAAGFAVQIMALVGAIALLSWLWPRSELVATKLLVGGIVLLLASGLWHRVEQANRTLARFIAAIGHGDLTQAFRQRSQGSGFDELGAAFDGAMKRLRDERLASAAENRFAAALVDEAPTPLLSIDADGVVTLANKAARRLFRENDGRTADTFRIYGAEFASALATAQPGGRRVVRLLWDDLPQRAILSTSAVERRGRSLRIASVQIIQKELDAAEITTQTDLVRVLTHEIMNSLTPVTSLAATAATLIATADGEDAPALADARVAIEALARRTAGLSRFVESYREFTRSPKVTIKRFAVRPWIEETVRLFAASPSGCDVTVDLVVTPEQLRMSADPDLLGQVVLNLLKNGGEAARSQDAPPRIAIEIRQNANDRTMLWVRDNGPGIPVSMASDIFLPFFTTKSEGSGVGLSFARQIVQLHGGTIGPDTQDGDRWSGMRITI